ncbi:MAG: hypothetical protein F6J87_10155 [Spirulina sp. SIO3F2]|nr:hypothetical protein [Spirulina sp. SIO3F2]
MKISFDLDDTLVCRQNNIPQEPNPIPFFLKPWFREPLRAGTCQLMTTLRKQSHEICIYTSSYRSPFYIRCWFWLYGITLGEVINQTVHNQHLQNSQRRDRPSKDPRLFGIHLHIDDSEGVKQEGKKLGFRVCQISPQDDCWVTRVFEEVQGLSDRF